MENFNDYLKNFDYPSIPEMKINSKKLLEELPKGDIQVIDVRFKEEYAMWKTMDFLNIPLNELPQRIAELAKNKLIVVVCPNSTRSNIAALYLRLNGFKSKFLTDGLFGLNQRLLGNDARIVTENLKNNQ